MRIPLKYSNYIYISGLISIPSKRVTLRPLSNAIIDTGSPETILSEGQALQLGISVSKLTLTRHANLGGTVYELYSLGPVTVKFKDSNESFQSFEFKDMCVAKTTKEDSKSKQISQAMPSIFGTNFLLANQLALYFAPHKNEVHLEKE